jgi:secernin
MRPDCRSAAGGLHLCDDRGVCDTLCALPPASANGVTVFAKNSDRPPTEPQDLEWHAPRVDDGSLRTTYLEIEPHGGETLGVLGSRPRWMWGFEHGVNEAGLAVGNEAVYTTLDPRPFPPALVGMDLVRLALERAPDAAAGVEVVVGLLERHGQGGGGHDGGAKPYWSSFLLADPGRAFVLETSGTDVAVEEVTDRRAISNRTTIGWFDEACGIRSPSTAVLVDPRLEASRAVLASGPVGVDLVKQHLRSHAGGADGWTVCMHADVEATTASMVVALPEEGPRIAHVLLGQPCRSLYVPVVVGEPLGEVPPWERFASLGDDGVDERRAAEAALAREVRPGCGWNMSVWARIDDLLAEGT